MPSLDYLEAARDIAQQYGAAVHMDRARMFNAAIGFGIALAADSDLLSGGDL